MALIDWSPKLSVGVAEIDEQHKKWIGITNELNDAMKSGKGSAVLGTILKEIENYVAFHFSHEEKLMEKAGYTDIVAHKAIHTKYTLEMKKLNEEFKAGKLMLSLQVMDSLKNWLTSHIQGQDQKYTAALNAKGIK